jgi:hypothetical protein
VPALIGAFAGAPVLAREMETGTFRFAWTQGFGRWRWALAKLAALAVVLAAAAGAFGVLVSCITGRGSPRQPGPGPDRAVPVLYRPDAPAMSSGGSRTQPARSIAVIPQLVRALRVVLGARRGVQPGDRAPPAGQLEELVRHHV